jgi:hypothetical protein
VSTAAQQVTVYWVIRLDPVLPAQTETVWLGPLGHRPVDTSDEAEFFATQAEAARVADKLRGQGHKPVVCQWSNGTVVE